MNKYLVFYLKKIKTILSKRKIIKFNKELNPVEVRIQFKNLTTQYKYFHHYFWNLSPTWLKEHRDYFSKEERGFGEEAFHAMWYLLFNKFKPKNVLEIGVYRGQTVSLFSLLSEKFCFKTEIHGISPFTSSGDGVSKYLDDLDYYKDVKKNFDYFGLPSPTFHKGFSTDEEMVEVIKTKQWDIIYIDGNHDYEVVKLDFEICSKQLIVGGLIVLDDASLYTDYKPPFYSTAGHPGPSKLANEIDMNLFEEILSVGHNRVFKKK